MNASDEELDNLFRNHLAAELDPMRRQAGRAFAREVTGPMHRRLRINAWRDVCRTARTALSLQSLARRARPMAAMAGAMTVAGALGFIVPHWLAGPATPAGGMEVAEVQPTQADFSRPATTRIEQIAPAEGGFGENRTRVESADFVDPQTNAHTQIYLYPNNQEIVPPAARQ